MYGTEGRGGVSQGVALGVGTVGQGGYTVENRRKGTKKRNDAEHTEIANYSIGSRPKQRVYSVGSPHRQGVMAMSRMQADVDMLSNILSANGLDLEASKHKAAQHFKYATWVLEGSESTELLYHDMVEEAKGKGFGWPALNDQLVWALLGEMAEHLGHKWPLQPATKTKNGERDTVVKIALAELYEALWRGPGGAFSMGAGGGCE